MGFRIVGYILIPRDCHLSLWPSDGANPTQIMQPACSAGPAVCPLRCAQGRLCGSSSDAGSCRAANRVIRIIMGRAAKNWGQATGYK